MRLPRIVLALGLALPLAARAAGALDDMTAPKPAAPEAGGSAWHDIRVQVVAHNAASLGAPMSGRLAEFPLRDGDRFAQGALLARFVCDEQAAALAHARALLGEKRQVLATNTRLRNLGTNSGLEFQVAQAQVEEEVAEVDAVGAQLANCVVRAPFPGRVAGVSVRQYQFVGLGQPLLEILDDRTLELELIVPSLWLAWLRPGALFGVTVEETGHSYRATLDRLSGKVDAVSQSIKAYGHLIDPAPDLLAGMSGHADLAPPAGAPRAGAR